MVPSQPQPQVQKGRETTRQGHPVFEHVSVSLQTLFSVQKSSIKMEVEASLSLLLALTAAVGHNQHGNMLLDALLPMWELLP